MGWGDCKASLGGQQRQGRGLCFGALSNLQLTPSQAHCAYSNTQTAESKQRCSLDPLIGL